MKYRIPFCYLTIFLTVTFSCSKNNKCQDVNLGIVSRIDEGSSYLDLNNVDSFVYIAQDSNLISFPLYGSRVDNSNKVIRYKCTDDGNFYTANYKTEVRTTILQNDIFENYFGFEERAELPLKNSVESNDQNERATIINQFANQVRILVYNNVAPPRKLSLFTKAKDEDLDLYQINQLNNQQLAFHDSITLNGQIFFNVYSNKNGDDAASEVFYSKEKGVIQFTDRDDNILTLDKIIFK